MSGIMNMFVATKTTIATAVDAFFNSVSLLLNTNSTNGAQNNTFLDSSTNNFTITRNGNTTQGTFTPFSQTGWSNYFSSSYLSASATLISTTATTFTMEGWIYMTATPVSGGNVPGLCGDMLGGATTNYMSFGPLANGTLGFQWFNGSTNVTAAGNTVMSLNTWYHVAVSVNASSIKLFVNGVDQTITGTSTLTNRGGTSSTFTIAYNSTQASITGYVSNLRVTNTAVYTSTFTPSTTPLTAITGTLLLTAQSNRFIDNSASPYTLTATSSPSVQAFSPFLPTAAYDTAVVGGSGYFDGSGDSLTTPSSANLAIGTSDFCIEWFYYQTNSATSATPLSQWGGSNNDWILQYNSSNLIFYYASSSIGYAYTPVPNQWTHACVCRSGSTMSLYLNGVRVNTKTDSTSIPNTRGLTVGANPDTSSQDCTGYISNARIVVGSSVYNPSSTTLTVPTAPLTAVTGTKFLLSATNSGIFDSASKNVLETVGNAQVSTTQAKWGTTAMYFDGTGDSLKGKLNNAIGGGDYTIEGWLYTGASGARYVFDMRETSQYLGAFTVGTTLYVNIGTTLDIVATTSYPQNTWVHFAMVRSGSASNNTSIFLGGSRVTQVTDTTNYSIVPTLYVGNDNTSSYSWDGYIDDFRITKGYARYSGSTYTPPAAAFPVQ